MEIHAELLARQSQVDVRPRICMTRVQVGRQPLNIQRHCL